jgi:hypothetical protein
MVDFPIFAAWIHKGEGGNIPAGRTGQEGTR